MSRLPRHVFYRFSFVLGALALTACAPGAHPTPSTSTSAPAPRYGPACAEARARARSEPEPPGLVPPRPDSVFLPPFPVPAAVRGQTAVLTFAVDSLGRAPRDSIGITGIPDAEYARRIQREAARVRFTPARLDGCAVAGRATITYSF